MFGLFKYDKPASFYEDLLSHTTTEWMAVMRDETSLTKKSKVYELVDLPFGGANLLETNGFQR